MQDLALPLSLWVQLSISEAGVEENQPAGMPSDAELCKLVLKTLWHR